MNYIAEFLLRSVSEKDAFCLFLHALRNKHLCCVYETNLPVLSDFMDIYEYQLSHNLPELSDHLKANNFLAPFYSIEWFTTLFTLSCPPVLTLGVWDLFFFGLKDALLRCAIAMMEILQDKLMFLGTEDLLKNFRIMASNVDAEEVLKSALKVVIVPCKVKKKMLSIPPGDKGDVLLALRIHYLRQTEEVRRERGDDTDRRTKEKEDRHNRKNKSSEQDSGKQKVRVDSEDNCVSYIPAFSNDEYFDADESLMIKVAELRQVASMCDRFFNVNLFMRKWVDCLPLFKSELTRYILADQLLREALSNGVHIRIISFLLAVCGADPNSQDLFLYTPLHIAAMNNRYDAARVLLMSGGDTNIYGALGFSLRGRMKLPADVISNISHVSMNLTNWPATLVLLRGKCCVHCNILVPSATSGPAKCCHCHLTLCTNCTNQHCCIYQLMQEEKSFSASGDKKVLLTSKEEGEMKFDGVEKIISDAETIVSSESYDDLCSLDESSFDATITKYPPNWKGYRGTEITGPQPWQKLLLPLLFDITDLVEIFDTQDDKISSAHHDEKFVSDKEGILNPNERKGQFHHSKSMHLDNPSLTLTRSIHGPPPRFLYYRDEVRESLKSLYRDAKSMSEPIADSSRASREDKSTITPSHTISESEKKIAIVAAILNRHWEMKDDNFLWVQDDLAWNCRDCFVQFSVFQRKHHCRRCGGLFCGEHAPLVELITCLPADICRGRSHDELIASVNLNQKELLEPVRLCKTCSFEICHAQAVFEEVWANKEKLSFSYWNEVVLEGRASVHLSDCTFPVNYKELEQWIGLNDSVGISLEVSFQHIRASDI